MATEGEEVSSSQAQVQSTLTGVSETMLLTLASRAADAKKAKPLLGDKWAAQTLAKINQRGRLGRSSGDSGFAAVIVLRALELDAWATEFLQANPKATVVHLACGLDSRALRLPLGPGVRWVDVDMPEVVEIRRKLLPEPQGDYRLVASSVTETAWLEEIPADRPTLVIMEGLLHYLEPEDVEQLVGRICNRFEGGQILCDTVGKTLKMMHYYAGRIGVLTGPIVRTGAVYRFAMDEPQTLAGFHPKLRVRDKVRFFQAPGYWEAIPWVTWALASVLTCFPGFRSYISFWRFEY